ncbi:unnamed protein product [Lactuca virosa]|uniref:Uncharacterized protein n=1 Tax=Lactuca virosa TaxID=75947 RepID=A0AAU9NIJ3_9ASTR|nr:unnamed protein product [Lactuca virosa]
MDPCQECKSELRYIRKPCHLEKWSDQEGICEFCCWNNRMFPAPKRVRLSLLLYCTILTSCIVVSHLIKGLRFYGDSPLGATDPTLHDPFRQV